MLIANGIPSSTFPFGRNYHFICKMFHSETMRTAISVVDRVREEREERTNDRTLNGLSNCLSMQRIKLNMILYLRAGYVCGIPFV